MDFVRGLAILLVIGSHLDFERPSDGIVGGIARAWGRVGGFGVSLFFVLSGFLISGLLLSEFEKHGKVSVARFLLRRGLKIYPPYFVFIAYLLAIPIAKALVSGRPVDILSANLLNDYWPNFLFIQNYVGPNLAGHTWSIAVEEHFYLGLPFLVLGLIRLRRTRLLLQIGLWSTFAFVVVRGACAFAGDPYVVDLHRTVAATHLSIDGLLFGVGLRAMEVYEPRLFARLRPWRIPLAAFAAAFLVLSPIGTRMLWGVPLYRILPLQTWAAAALFISIYHMRGSDFGRLLPGVRVALLLPLATIGLYSYNIYLWHVTALGIAGHAIRQLAWMTTVPSSWVFAATLSAMAAVALGIAAARAVEWPMLRIRDRLFPSRA